MVAEGRMSASVARMEWSSEVVVVTGPRQRWVPAVLGLNPCHRRREWLGKMGRRGEIRRR